MPVTHKFRLVPTLEQKQLLNRWAGWTRKSLNYILSREYTGLKRAMSEFTLVSKYATEKKVNQYIGIGVKSVHVESLMPKVVATLRTPEARNSFIVGRTRIGSIVKESGTFFFHVSDPFEKKMHDIRINAKDRRGISRRDMLEAFIDREFPFEIHYSISRRFWILHATISQEEGQKVVATRVMSMHLGIHNAVWAMVREERECLYSKRWKGGATRQMAKWQRDYWLHSVANEIVDDARRLNCMIVLEDLDFIQMLSNPGIEDLRLRALHRAMGKTTLSKFQDMVVARARKPQYVEGRLQPQVEVSFVDCRNICRTCPRCGSRDDEPEIHGKVFHCKSCNYTNNYDFVAAWNLWERGHAS